MRHCVGARTRDFRQHTFHPACPGLADRACARRARAHHGRHREVPRGRSQLRDCSKPRSVWLHVERGPGTSRRPSGLEWHAAGGRKNERTAMTKLPPYITIDANGSISRAAAPRRLRRESDGLLRFLVLLFGITFLAWAAAAMLISAQGIWLGAVLNVAAHFR